MTFNQTVWDALCYAAVGVPVNGLKALEQYAADCDGAVKQVWKTGDPNIVTYEFVPNPIPKY